MRPFVKLPLPILYSPDLSFGAKIVYGAIIRRAWLAGRQEETDGVALPPFDVIAEDINISRTAFKRYLAELRSHSVVVTRRSTGLVYYVFDDSATPEQLAAIGPKSAHRRTAQRADSGPSQRADSGPLQPGVLISPRESKPVDKKTSTTAIAVVGVMADLEAPAPVKIEGRNVPLDVLCEVCGIDPQSPKVRAAATSLGDQKKPKIPGIRSLFWIECRRAVAADPILTGRLLGLVHEPEHFEHALADRIRVKAEKIAASYPHLPITPHVIRDYWLDVELQPAAPGRPTSDVIRDAFREAEARRGR